jgi:FlaA1/EpsC-like NDP-sugar epimerase
MTIPEAVSLVLQAGSMADDGKVFLLDMGEPASILDMARQMIRLAGLRPHEDIEIKVTGRRRGERLIEKLHDDNETIEPTSHPSIWSVTPAVECDPRSVFRWLLAVERACAEANGVVSVRPLEQLLRASGVRCNLNLQHPLDLKAPHEQLAMPLEAGGVIARDAHAVRA